MYQWDELRIVLAVSRHGTLASAARALRINATTVGRRLEAFERRLGAKLFTKTRDGLRPTRAGDTAIDTASRIEDGVVAFERRTRDHDARLDGVVRITAGDGVMLSVAPLVSAFRSRYPGVQLELMAENRVIDLVRGEADIAIRLVKPTTSTLIAQRVATIGIGLYARDDYVAHGPRIETLDDLAAHTLIGMAPPFDNGPEAQWLARHGVTRYDVRCNTISLALALAAGGAGIAVLPHNLAVTEPRLRRVVRDARFQARDLWLVAHREVRNRAPVRATLTFLAEDFKRNAAAFAGGV